MRHVYPWLVLIAALFPRYALASVLIIRVLDVGQGNAILLSTDGRHVLIDAGPTDGIVDQLRSAGVEAVAALVLTHYHRDHVGGAGAVLRKFPVARCIDNGTTREDAEFAQVARALTRHSVPRIAAPPELALGDVRLRLLRPASAKQDQNNSSIGVVVEFGVFRAILPSDAQAAGLMAWLAAPNEVGRADVLMAAHHGSRDALTPAWLDRIRPQVVLISVGAANDYGHPHPWALRYYEADGRLVYRTDRDGTITISVDRQGGYAVRTANGGERALPRPATQPTSPE